MIVLGIESSCDETACALVKSGKILSSLIATQHEVHEKYGGVVPELASRKHMQNIVPLIKGALKKASLSISDIDGIAVTYAPGLIGSLLVGLSFAKGLSFSLGKPLIGVNHLEGHLSAGELYFGKTPTPYIALVVSGGHTNLYLVQKFGNYKLLGSTRDDAAGEAFDKAAKLMNLGYPGGPAIDKVSVNGNEKAFIFTRPKFSGRTMKGRIAKKYDFSFSGFKTALRNNWQQLQNENKATEQAAADLAASFQHAIVGFLVDNLHSAAIEYGVKAVTISGGVAANTALRKSVTDKFNNTEIKTFIPPMELCTDNAAMIAYVGERRFMLGEKNNLSLNAIANMGID